MPLLKASSCCWRPIVPQHLFPLQLDVLPVRSFRQVVMFPDVVVVVPLEEPIVTLLPPVPIVMEPFAVGVVVDVWFGPGDVQHVAPVGLCHVPGAGVLFPEPFPDV